MCGSESWAMIRYPHFKFRPSHNDIMHIDLWHKGNNVLSDAGTFSYNQSGMIEKFNLKSVHYHNTVSFDGQEQMPEISRFLLGAWINPDQISEIEEVAQGYRWEGQYSVGGNQIHKRVIFVDDDVWTIEDYLMGDFKSATIGFNISDDDYRIEKNIIFLNWGRIVAPPTGKIIVKHSRASLHYLEMHETQRVEIEVSNSEKYTTRIELKN